MSPIKEILSSKIRLPSPPAIAIKILDTVRKDNFTFEDLADVIESDPALTARILKAANSPYYKLSSKVNSVEKSLSILGSHAVTNIALSFVICSEFQIEGCEAFDTTSFWRRSLSSAVAAELTAKLVGNNCSDIFITALLQDIGIMVMYGFRPHDYQLVLNQRKELKQLLTEAERAVFDCDHQEVGADLLKSWHLPKEIYEPIRYHHQEGAVPEKCRSLTSVLKIASDLASFYNDCHDVEIIRRVKRVLGTEFKVNGDAVDNLIESSATSTIEMLSAFEIAPGDLRPFSRILQEANEELCDLYDSYELQIIELKQSKKKLEKLAKELTSANMQLRELASRDGLTDVYNYRLYQETLDREIIRAQRYGQIFSLISFDVDGLKNINDVHGHPAGDLVLVSICRAISKIIRGADTFARCGGDEFVVVMPETDLASAMIAAEHMKQCVKELEIRTGVVVIRPSISTGCSSYDPSDKVFDKQKLIDTADKALYQAKESVMNRAVSFSEHQFHV